MLRIASFPVGSLGTNCVLVWDPQLGEGLVVDPGGDTPRIRAQVAEAGCRIVALLHTHAHFDHLGATAELQEAWACPAWLHPEDSYLIESLDIQTSLFGMPAVRPPQLAAIPQALPLGLAWRHTPGHSRGSCTYLGAGEAGPFALSGDTLFAGGVGRTDVLGGDAEALARSIREQLYVLPDETLVVPGHGPRTTIGSEAHRNPFVRRGAASAGTPGPGVL